jgi:dipeptidase
MCDTIVKVEEGRTLFAKNSDREAAEPQVVQYFPAASGDTTATINTTYIDLPQVSTRYALFLSRPIWMWGAEMGVNEKGVAIGNEAVFSKLAKQQSTTLLGMDLLRLSLERAATSREALEILTSLLQAHGQGGPAGYRNKRFKYDNSYIIADGNEAWVLETAGQHWVARKVKQQDAISNAYTIGSEYDLCSEGLEDFARQQGFYNGSGDFNFKHSFEAAMMTKLASASKRRECNQTGLGQLAGRPTDLMAMAALLRTHGDAGGFKNGSNGDVCMHAAGLTRQSQTTGALVAELIAGEPPRAFFTGSSATCLSLFKPVSFDRNQTNFVEASSENEQKSLWHHFEPLHRLAIFNQDFRSSLQQSLIRVEAELFHARSHPTADGLARRWFEQAQEMAGQYQPDKKLFSAYDWFWRRQQ